LLSLERGRSAYATPQALANVMPLARLWSAVESAQTQSIDEMAAHRNGIVSDAVAQLRRDFAVEKQFILWIADKVRLFELEAALDAVSRETPRLEAVQLIVGR
jgi:hypothetical protein